MAATGELTKVIHTTTAHLSQKESSRNGVLEKTDGSCCSVHLVLSIAPGVITSLVCLIGIIALNALHQHYLSIPFAIGSASGLYTIYQGYQSHLLKSFYENLEKLKQLIAQLEQQITELIANNDTYKIENQKLADSNIEIKATINELKEENNRFNASNKELRENLNELRSANKTHEETASRQIAQLEALKTSLKGIQESVEKDHSQFGHHVECFKGDVKDLRELISQLGTPGSHLDKIMTILMQLVEALESTFTKINDKFIAQQVQLQQNTQSNLAALEKQISRYEVYNQREQNIVSDLAKIKIEFENVIKLACIHAKKTNEGIL